MSGDMPQKTWFYNVLYDAQLWHITHLKMDIDGYT